MSTVFSACSGPGVDPQADEIEGAEGAGIQAVLPEVVMRKIAGVVVIPFRQTHGPVHIAVSGHNQGLEEDGAAVAGRGIVGEHRPAAAESPGKIVPLTLLQLYRAQHLSAAKRAAHLADAVCKQLRHENTSQSIAGPGSPRSTAA